MLGVSPRPWDHSGASTTCPWIECGEPICDEFADGPDAEYVEGAARSSGDSMYCGASAYIVFEPIPVLLGYCSLGYEYAASMLKFWEEGLKGYGW